MIFYNRFIGWTVASEHLNHIHGRISYSLALFGGSHVVTRDPSSTYQKFRVQLS